MKRILLVEDEENIRDVVKMNLEMDGYEVVTSGNGKDALEKVAGQRFDLVLLDLMLPDVSGLQVCEQVRLTKGSSLPILMLTAKDTDEDRITGFRKGADDYLTKPFNLEELQLRIKALLRRSSDDSRTEVELHSFGKNSVNFATYEAIGTDGPFVLTKKEALLLKLLIEREKEVVSREDILQTVWGYDVFPSTRTIDNFVLSFRKYFEEDPRNPKHFLSVRGVGYKFKS